jgi:aspartate dehydrogenase
MKTGAHQIKIGLMGCGSMGAELARCVGPGGVKNATVAALFDSDAARANALSAALPSRPVVCASIPALLAIHGLDLVIECASQSAVKAHGPAIMNAGKSLLLMSSGALLDPGTYAAMTTAAERTGAEIMVPSGAVGGIDALRAVRKYLESVTLVSTKKPAALSGAPGFAEYEGREIKTPVVVFEGNAVEAVNLFPANVNVAATVSLAGIGPEKTQVRVVADPDSPGNVHEIRATGGFGEFSFKLVNRPHPDNPKTSHLAVLAAIETLRSIAEPGLRIGT